MEATAVLVAGVSGRGKAAGETAYFGEVEEVEVMVETVFLGALFSTGLSGGTVTEEVTTGSAGAGTVFTTAMAGEARPAVVSGLTGREQLLFGPCPALLVQVTRNLNVPPGGRSVTL